VCAQIDKLGHTRALRKRLADGHEMVVCGERERKKKSSNNTKCGNGGLSIELFLSLVYCISIIGSTAAAEVAISSQGHKLLRQFLS
jgi:hypothetical protein